MSAAAPGAAEKTRVRDAVSVLVVSWVESYPEDFESDQSLLRLLTDLNRLAEKEPTSPKATAQLQEACVRACRFTPFKVVCFVHVVCMVPYVVCID